MQVEPAVAAVHQRMLDLLPTSRRAMLCAGASSYGFLGTWQITVTIGKDSGCFRVHV